MKIFGFIFACYVLFLGFEPGIRALSFTEGQESCCCDDLSCQPIGKAKPENEQDKKGCDESGNCNPFQTCSSCTAFADAFVNPDISRIISFSQHLTATKEKVPPSVALDFWQPPKIA